MARRNNILLWIKLIVAFCSIVYELLLAQSLSAFLQNTVLRYSITIGLYLCAMGFGAMMAEGRIARHPVLSLLRVEILLTLLGGFCVVILHLLNMAAVSRIVFAFSAHLLIILVGVLTGFELPLVLEIAGGEQQSENTILAVDYLGALLGTVAFALFFYPQLGLVPTAFFIGSLNSLAGLSLFTQRGKVPAQWKRQYRTSLTAQTLIFTVILVCLRYAAQINEFFIKRYIGG